MKPVLIAIVKNEEKNIIRCLESCSHLFDRFVINSSGTTDETVKLGSEWMSENGKSGLWISPEWKGAADALNACIEQSKNLEAEWCLRIDADMVADGDLPDFLKLDSEVTALDIAMHRMDGTFISHRPFLFKPDFARYVGVRHEGLHTALREQQTDLRLLHHADSGARPRESQTYIEDFTAMFEELPNEMNDDLIRRYVFYMANSARDAGDLFTAAVWFRVRSLMSGYNAEVSVSQREHALIANDAEFWIKAVAENIERADMVYWALAVSEQFGPAFKATIVDLAEPIAWKRGLMFLQDEYLWQAGHLMINALCEMARFDEAREVLGRVSEFPGADLEMLSASIPSMKVGLEEEE